MNLPSRRHFVQAAGLLGAGLFAGINPLAASETPPLAPPDKQPPDLELPEAVTRKVGWAIVGLGKLALEEVMPAFARCKLSRPASLVSGHPDKARKVAAAYGVDPKNIFNYDNFDKLAGNTDVDVVYVILPNSMHAEYTIRALQAGKHVLCEKPMAVSAKECERMIAAAGEARKQLMIAYRLHYEPFNQKVMELCRKQEFGPVKTISSSNCQDVKAPNIRLSKQLGGGPVGDIGIYSINAARYITGEQPIEVAAFAQQNAKDPRFREVPESVAFTLRFPGGALAHCDCSFASAESRRYRVHCPQGLIELDPAFSYRGLRLFLHRGERREEVRLREVDHFAAEMDHCSACVLQDRPCRTPGAEGLADLRVIEAIEEAARTGRAVRVKA
jgi:predicted dehydrogenase